MQRYKVIAITHKHTDVDTIGLFHLDDKVKAQRLTELKVQTGIKELMYLSTCNRVEFHCVCDSEFESTFLKDFFTAFQPLWTIKEITKAIKLAEVKQGEDALKHTYSVASSVDSMVVGEREIITQVRQAFETSRELLLTGDTLRLIIERAIETAKEVFTQTAIGSRPVSVVSLAYGKLKEMGLPLDSRILVVGAGQTNTTMTRFLSKHGFTNIKIFNRTLKRAQILASDAQGEALQLAGLSDFTEGFDIMITCTGASEPVITTEIFDHLVNGDTNQKWIVDLAVPADVAATIPERFNVKHVGVQRLKQEADKNLIEREKELQRCEVIIDKRVDEFRYIFRTRQIERTMGAVPDKVKAINEKALNEVFSKEIDAMDEESRETLHKVATYLEKKYISEPMKLAKEILLDQVQS